MDTTTTELTDKDKTHNNKYMNVCTEGYFYEMGDIKIDSFDIWRVFKTSDNPKNNKLLSAGIKRKKPTKNQKYDETGALDRAVTFSEMNGNLPIFALQNLKWAGYQYIVTTYPHFWKTYKDMSLSERRFNEILGENAAAHFHMDCECYRATNPQFQIKSQAEVDILQETHSFIISTMSVILTPEEVADLKVIIMDASNEEKISKHYVVKIKNKMFRNNLDIGVLIKLELSKINKTSSLLFIKSKNGKPGWFIDTAIYSRNRPFRLKYSTKPNAARPLIDDRTENKYSSPDHNSFMDSLVCATYPDKQPMTIIDLKTILGTEYRFPSNHRIKAFTHTHSGSGDIYSRFLKNRVDMYKDNEDYYNVEKDVEIVHSSKETAYHQTIQTSLSSSQKKSVLSCDMSYFKKLNHTMNIQQTNVLSLLSKVVNFELYSPHINEEDDNVRFQVYSKICEIKGAEHSSNNVSYMFFLDKMQYRQCCLSPFCAGKKGVLKNIPTEYTKDLEKYTQSTNCIPISKYFGYNKLTNNKLPK